MKTLNCIFFMSYTEFVYTFSSTQRSEQINESTFEIHVLFAMIMFLDALRDKQSRKYINEMQCKLENPLVISTGYIRRIRWVNLIVLCIFRRVNGDRI